MTLLQTLTLVGTLLPIVAAASYVAILWVVRPLELKLETHIAEDAAIHPMIQASLLRLEAKLDQLTCHLLTREDPPHGHA